MPNPGSVTPVRYDLAQVATVSAVISSTQFVSSMLGVFGDGTFFGYSAWVLAKADGSTTSPKGDGPSPVSGFIGAGGTSPTTRGLVTFAGFTAPLSAGDTVLLLHPSIANITVGKAQATVKNSVTANWQAAEQSLVNVGADGTSYRFHMMNISIANLVGNIAIRMYSKINGVKTQFFPEPSTDTFSVNAVPPDPPGIPVINASVVITEQVQVTVQSDNAADNGKAVAYEYKLEAM